MTRYDIIDKQMVPMVEGRYVEYEEVQEEVERLTNLVYSIAEQAHYDYEYFWDEFKRYVIDPQINKGEQTHKNAGNN